MHPITYISTTINNNILRCLLDGIESEEFPAAISNTTDATTPIIKQITNNVNMRIELRGLY